MMYSEFNYLIAQQHAAEALRAAERQRLARTIRVDRRERAASHWIARVGAAFHLLRRPLVAPESR